MEITAAEKLPASLFRPHAKASKRMILIVVLAAVLAVSTAGAFAAVIIGIRRGDRHYLVDAPRSGSDILARRLLVRVRYSDSTEGEDR